MKTMEDTYDQRLKNDLSRYFKSHLHCLFWLILSPQLRHIQLVTNMQPHLIYVIHSLHPVSSHYLLSLEYLSFLWILSLRAQRI